MRKQHWNRAKRRRLRIANKLFAFFILFIILVVTFDFNPTFKLFISRGVSQGPPFCKYCPGLMLTKNIPLVTGEDYIYRSQAGNLLNHKLVGARNDRLVFEVYKSPSDLIEKDAVVGLVLFEIPLSTTNDFMEACLNTYPSEDNHNYCKNWMDGKFE